MDAKTIVLKVICFVIGIIFGILAIARFLVCFSESMQIGIVGFSMVPEFIGNFIMFAIFGFIAFMCLTYALGYEFKDDKIVKSQNS
jgi:hypothetical protein